MHRTSSRFVAIVAVFALVTACASADRASEASSGGGDMTEAASMSAAPSAPSSRADSDEASDSASSRVDTRKLKRNASIDIRVDDEDDFEDVIEQASTMAEEANGYVINASNDRVVMMVPTGETRDFLKQLSTLGKVKDRSLRVDDVTAQYVDLEVRIDNLERTRQRLKTLMDKTENVSEILEVEKELSRVTTELEQHKARMRSLERDTTYGRVTLNVDEKTMPGPIGWIFYGGYHAVKWLFVWD
ncbi:MAG: DUF4349 domain-containing protein [Persicimonas sp.]